MKQVLKINKELKPLLQNAEEIWIAVAMMSEYGLQQIVENASSNTVLNILVGIDLPTPPSVLQKLLDFQEASNWNCRLYLGKGEFFHPKLYVIRTNNSWTAIVGSGNCTKGGLEENIEMNLSINDPNVCANLISSYFNNYFKYAQPIAPDLISEYEGIFERRKEREKADRQELKKLSYNFGQTAEIFSANDTINYWLKPIGVTEDPVTPERLFNEFNYPLHFAQPPNSVQINDVVFCYGVGVKKMLSVYKVVSEAKQLQPDEGYDEEWMKRWPWVIQSENLTMKYGGEWSKYDLYLSILKNEFLDKNPKGLITTSSQSLGGLSWGKDKLRLSKDFARYIHEKISHLSC